MINLYIDNKKHEFGTIHELKAKVFELYSTTDRELKSKARGEANSLLAHYLKSVGKFKAIRQDEKQEVWAYYKGIYIPNGKSIIKEQLSDMLGTFYNHVIALGVTEKIIPMCYIDSNEFYNQNYEDIIPVENGLLEIKPNTKGEYTLRDFDPEKIFFSKLPVTYKPGADCKIIKKHLNDVFANDDDIVLFQEAIGNCLYKKYKYQKAIMMLGKGRNGKGVTLDLINRFLGADNCSALTLDSIENDKYSIADLHGKLVNTAGDLDKAEMKKSGTLKNLTGGDLVSADRKFMTKLTFTNYAKFFFACNELPKTNDRSDGFFSRWIIFDFPYKFVREHELKNSDKGNLKLIDTEIKDKLFEADEMSGFLNFALGGLDRLNKSNGFSYSKTDEETKDKWMGSSDSSFLFVKQMLYRTKDTKQKIRFSDVVTAYAEYCYERGLNSEAPSKLNKNIFDLKRITKDRLMDEHGERDWWYRSLSLTNNEDNEDGN